MDKIFYKDIFLTPLDALVNPVNCKGIMGAGLAREFKKRFSANFVAYRQACIDSTLKIGKVFIYRTQILPGKAIQPKYIINFPTKYEWHYPSTIEMIELGLDDMVRRILEINTNPKLDAWHIHSLGIPALGCGLGGLNWDEVLPLIMEKTQPLNEFMDIRIYGPTDRTKYQDGISA